MPQTKIIYISISIILAVLLFGLGYYLGATQGIFVEKPVSQEKLSGDLEAGVVGEVTVKDEKTGEESPLVSPIMPPAIFGTAGKVVEVKSDRLIIAGNGTNFADGVPRSLTAIFNAGTITFNKNQSFKWQGLIGLRQFKAGMEILIESANNIRGKTEFEVKTINIL